MTYRLTPSVLPVLLYTVFTSPLCMPIRPVGSFPVYSPEEEGAKLRPGVVLLTGLMESMVKYGETIAHLNDRWVCIAADVLCFGRTCAIFAV